MPYIRINYRSDWAGRKDIGVFYPKQAPSASVDHTPWGTEPKKTEPLPKDGKYQMLWLIHDDPGDFTDWALKAAIQELCDEKQLFVVMPTVQDFVGGLIEMGTFFQMVALELPEYMNNLFPVSPAGEDNFIAGCGFGGYFAYRIAMKYPHRYAAVASFSGLLDIVSAIKERHEGQDGFYPAEEMRNTEKDILHIVRQNVRNGVQLPALYQYCGTDDFSRGYNQTAYQEFRSLGLNPVWTDIPGGYNYTTWDTACKDFINRLNLACKPVFPDKNIVLPRGGKHYED